MAYEHLLKRNRIQPYSARPIEITQLLNVAKRDLIAAEKNRIEAPDWAYSMAYNAALQSSRALILKEGYRPRGADQHATVVEFVAEKLGAEQPKQVALLDQMRRKRHRVIYETAGLVSGTEAKQAIAFATAFVERITKMITGQDSLPVE